MAKNNNLTDFLTGVADAIRTKKGTTDLINPQDFDSEIASIKTEKPEQEKTVTIAENGTTEVMPDTDKVLSKVTVTTDVQPTLQEKTVAPTTTQQIVTADSGKDGLSKVTVEAVTAEIDSNIVPENIKKDITILGVTGTLESGGGQETTGDYTVKVIDYDGTVLLEKKGNTGDVIDLPTAPTHDKLIFEEWSASVNVTNNQVTIADNDITVGAIYTTASGQSEFDITLTKVTGLSVTLKMNGTKDWGDGSSGTTTTHTYTAYGDYTIKCNGKTMTTSSSSGLFGQSSSAINYSCVRVRLANITSIGGYALNYCYSLTSITIPSSGISIGSNAFQACYSLTSISIPDGTTNIRVSAFSDCASLTSITIPSSITIIGNNAFYNCSSLTSITIPSGVTSIGTYAFFSCYTLTNISIPSITSIGDYAFYYCHLLTSITIPSGVTSIGMYAFGSCYSLTNITIPSSITSIGKGAFYYCYSITKYDFSQCTSVPSLSNTNAFSNINGICKIVVPDSLAGEWAAATNWSTYADYIYKASEV